jgi:UDP-glucose 4-epimerase
MNILVTGGAGFIGSHIVDSLVLQGYTVHVLDNLSGGFERNVHAKATLHRLDINSPEVETIWAEHRFEVMFHLAAQMDVRKSVADPIFDANINVIGLLHLLEVGKRNGLRKVVFSSTGGAIYGEPDYVPQDESHINRPESPYGITKLISEHYLRFYGKTYGLEWIALRYANVYGPRQNAHGEAGVIAIFAERMLRNEQCHINGDGLQTRDFVYVRDVVDANLRALKHHGNGIYNVGTGIETDLITLFRHIKALAGSTIPEAHADAKPGEQMRSVIGTALIEKELGWRRHYDLKIGLAETVGWFRSRMTGK